MEMTLPLDALLYTVPVLTAILAELQPKRGWLWYYTVFLIGCAVVYLVKKFWR